MERGKTGKGARKEEMEDKERTNVKVKNSEIKKEIYNRSKKKEEVERGKQGKVQERRK